jgi:hypothetical protein
MRGGVRELKSAAGGQLEGPRPPSAVFSFDCKKQTPASG